MSSGWAFGVDFFLFLVLFDLEKLQKGRFFSVFLTKISVYRLKLGKLLQIISKMTIFLYLLIRNCLEIMLNL